MFFSFFQKPSVFFHFSNAFLIIIKKQRMGVKNFIQDFLQKGDPILIRLFENHGTSAVFRIPKPPKKPRR